MLREDLESLGEEMRDGELSRRFLKLFFWRKDSGGELPGFIFTGRNLSVKDGTSETTAYHLGGGQGGRECRREGGRGALPVLSILPRCHLRKMLSEPR